MQGAGGVNSTGVYHTTKKVSKGELLPTREVLLKGKAQYS